MNVLNTNETCYKIADNVFVRNDRILAERRGLSL